MSGALAFILAGALVLCVGGWAVIWSRRDSWVRHAVLPALVALLPLLALGTVNVLSWHRPVALGWDMPGEVRVLGSKLIEGTGIYVYLDTDGEPRAFSMPWDQDTAQALQDALRQSQQQGEEGAMMRFDPSLKDFPSFHPMPQPQVPMPKGTPPPAERYERI